MDGAMRLQRQFCAVLLVVFVMTNAVANGRYYQHPSMNLVADPSIERTDDVYTGTYRLGLGLNELLQGDSGPSPNFLPYCSVRGQGKVSVRLQNSVTNDIVATGFTSQYSPLYWAARQPTLTVGMAGSYRCKANRPSFGATPQQNTSASRYDLKVVAEANIFRLTIEPLRDSYSYNATCCASGMPRLSLTIGGDVPQDMIHGYHHGIPSVCGSVTIDPDEDEEHVTTQCTATLSTFICSPPTAARDYCEDARRTVTQSVGYEVDLDRVGESEEAAASSDSDFSREVFAPQDGLSTFGNCDSTCTANGYSRLSTIENRADYDDIIQKVGEFSGEPGQTPAWVGLYIQDGQIVDYKTGDVLENFADRQYDDLEMGGGPAGTNVVYQGLEMPHSGPIFLQDDSYVMTQSSWNTGREVCVCERGVKPQFDDMY